MFYKTSYLACKLLQTMLALFFRQMINKVLLISD